MREIGGRDGLGSDPACLGQLERNLSRRAELDPTADHVHAADVGERGRDRRDGRLEPRQRAADLLRGLLHRGRNLLAAAGRVPGEQCEHGEGVEQRL